MNHFLMIMMIVMNPYPRCASQRKRHHLLLHPYPLLFLKHPKEVCDLVLVNELLVLLPSFHEAWCVLLSGKMSRSDLENDGEEEDEEFLALTPIDKNPRMDYQATTPRRECKTPPHIVISALNGPPHCDEGQFSHFRFFETTWNWPLLSYCKG